MKTILAPVDFSKVTDAVVEQATSLARAMDARVVLLAVVQPPVVVAEYAVVIDNVGEILAAGERHAARQLENLEAKLRAELPRVESIQLTGAPVANIVEQARKFDASYIVMGSHGHTAFYDLLVGSTTHGVLMRAPCPVVIVPAAKEKLTRKSSREARSVGV